MSFISNKVMIAWTVDGEQAFASKSMMPKEVSRRMYTFILDLNGLLLHRTYTRRTLHVLRRPSVTAFLNWLRLQAEIVLWSSVTLSNMDKMLNTLLADTSFGPGDVTFLTQTACTKSTYKAPSAPDKPIFLKDLSAYARIAGLSCVEDVLLIDDSPVKNLINDPDNVVFPRSWCGDTRDTFLDAHLRPWLERLFKSNEVVPMFVKNNPLFSGQSPMDALSREGFNILKGTMSPLRSRT